MESSVTQVIEQQLTGLDNLLYFSSTSSSAGTVQITATFGKGTNPNIAQVQVQNRAQQAIAQLPAEVQLEGLLITKANPDFLIIVGVYDGTDRAQEADVADWIVQNIEYPLGRLNGVGNTTLFGAGYAIRIWMNPYRLAALQLQPSDIAAAVAAQNVNVSAGQLGQLPSVKGQALNAIVTAKSLLQTPEQFRRIVVKSQANGAVVRLGDIARVEMGADTYTHLVQYNGHPAAGIGIQLAPGSDALKTAAAVKALVRTHPLPPGWGVVFVRDSTDFIRLSVEEVVKTLFEAIVLVVVVMFVFLQTWRATLVPAIAVPVVLLGTFGVLSAVGYSINTLDLFGMVLAIGLLIDDAIVVVENVERVMDEERLPPREAARKSMDEISGALIGIALVLSAVLVPMGFYGGSIGVIYQQFSVTIVSAMLLSIAVALILSPALCATALRPRTRSRTEGEGVGARFNRGFERMTRRYIGAVEVVTARKLLSFLAYGAIIVLLGFLFLRLPTGFLPNEDQGSDMAQFILPPGAPQWRTDAVRRQVVDHFLGPERRNVDGVFGVSGYSFAGQGENAGMAFVNLKPFDQRKGAQNSVDAINRRAAKAFSKIVDATVIPLNLPPIQGLGQTSGFTFELMNNTNLSRKAFAATSNRVLAAALADPTLISVRVNVLPDIPQLQIDIDDGKLAALGLTETDVISTLSSAWGSTYVNNFLDRGQIKHVYIQADAPFRRLPGDLDNLYVRSSGVVPDQTRNASGAQVTGGATGATLSNVAGLVTTGVTTGSASPFAFANASVSDMVPFNAFATTRWAVMPTVLTRFNGLPAYEIDGDAAAGSSTGQAMKRMIALQQKLAPGTSFAWSALSYQEIISSGQGPGLYAVSVLVVFLCLAALYESWSVPFAVLLVLPLGLIGAVLAVTLRGLDNNIYFQVGLLTTMGLAAKNAILIVEFAHAARLRGASPVDAALEGARLRLRPILMTSLAFVAGVFPLSVATGAGANSRIALGTAVMGGVITGTVLAIFFTPMFFVAVTSLFGGRKRAAPTPPEAPQGDRI